MKEDYGDGEYIISIPVSGHLSRHDANEKTLTFLVVFEDDNGEIRRGELAILDDPGNSIDSLSMYDLYLNNPLSNEEYSLKLVSLQDFMFVDKTMSKEHLKIHNSYYGKVMNEESCIHYYWVHGTYDLETGEILDYDITDLGCLSCPPNALCDHLDGGVGGGGGGDDKEVNKTFVFDMFGYNSPYFSYKCSSSYNVKGTKNNSNPSLNKFTEILWLNSHTMSHEPVAMFTWDTRQFSYEVTDHRENVVATSARLTITVLMHFYNKGEYRPQSGYKPLDPSIL